MTAIEPPLRAVVIDDHRLLAQSLALALDLEGVSCVVADLGDREELIRSVIESGPDLVLLDLDLGGTIGSGATLVSAFVAAGCRVLVVSASKDLEQVGAAIEAGAVGVVSKESPFEQLLRTAVAVAHGEEVLPATERRRMIGEIHAQRDRRASTMAPFHSLTPREAQVLRALADGIGVPTIAADWFVSEATVRSQVRGILTKLDVSSQLEAVAAAHRCGWLAL